MTYKQAYDKIIEAYFKDEIKPFTTQFCFCGTLADGVCWEQSGYLESELIGMEKALLTAFPGFIYLGLRSVQAHRGFVHEYIESLSNHEYETLLFAGMSGALDVLKQIHIERGEIIDEPIPFTQRQFV